MSHAKKPAHPYQELGLRPGKEVWIRATVKKIFPKGTPGYANGFVQVDVGGGEKVSLGAGGASFTVTAAQLYVKEAG